MSRSRLFCVVRQRRVSPRPSYETTLLPVDPVWGNRRKKNGSPHEIAAPPGDRSHRRMQDKSRMSCKALPSNIAQRTADVAFANYNELIGPRSWRQPVVAGHGNASPSQWHTEEAQSINSRRRDQDIRPPPEELSIESDSYTPASDAPHRVSSVNGPRSYALSSRYSR